MTIHSEPREGINRRDAVIWAATAAAGMATTTTVLAQAPGPGNATPAAGEGKGTVVLDRLPRGVLLIGIDRPEAQNRIDIPTFNALGQAYYQLEHDNDLRVAVLHGKGADFSQGLDVQSWGAALRNGPFQAPPNFIDPLGTSGPERAKPLVIAVQGHVIRVAHELFLASDIRIAAQDTVFDQGEVTTASFPGGGATVRFVREAGWANAMRYMLTGEEWRADDAYRMGLVQAVIPAGQQLDRATEIAKKIAANAPLAVHATMASARRSLSEGERIALLTLQPEFGRLLRSEDRQEYIHSLQERRAPVYQGH